VNFRLRFWPDDNALPVTVTLTFPELTRAEGMEFTYTDNGIPWTLELLPGGLEFTGSVATGLPCAVLSRLSGEARRGFPTCGQRADSESLGGTVKAGD